MNDTAVRDLCTDLLAAAVGVLDSPPDRQYVAHGDSFAHDCEMIAVRVRSVAPSNDTDSVSGMAACAVVPVVGLQLVVLRCYPTVEGGVIPTAAALTAASQVLADDAVQLTGSIIDLWSAGTLFPTVAVPCDRVELGGLVPVSPEGGLAGWRCDFDVRV